MVSLSNHEGGHTDVAAVIPGLDPGIKRLRDMELDVLEAHEAE